MRRLTTGLWLVSGLMLTYALIYSVAHHSYFAIRHVEVVTPLAHTHEAQLRRVVQRAIDGGFFSQPLDTVRARVEKLPWAREARLTRRWPDTLVLAVQEHQAVAHWGTGRLISDRGVVFDARLNAPLPQLEGPEGSGPEVLAAWQRYQQWFAPQNLQVTALSLSARRAWTLTRSDGLRIALGRFEADARLRRFLDFYPQIIARLGGVPQYVDLRYPDGFALGPVMVKPAGVLGKSAS
jgi:cell division protein FtsQ